MFLDFFGLRKRVENLERENTVLINILTQVVDCYGTLSQDLNELQQDHTKLTADYLSHLYTKYHGEGTIDGKIKMAKPQMTVDEEFRFMVALKRAYNLGSTPESNEPPTQE